MVRRSLVARTERVPSERNPRELRQLEQLRRDGGQPVVREADELEVLQPRHLFSSQPSLLDSLLHALIVVNLSTPFLPYPFFTPPAAVQINSISIKKRIVISFRVSSSTSRRSGINTLLQLPSPKHMCLLRFLRDVLGSKNAGNTTHARIRP